ncbi:MAG TPA: SidA/IucD/PvdA family monooxygenase, partial [Kofleriaceae bacterium]|nr:SidA/IucD/PvdA family monooxygenase [Kofleriaceae bacterium]
MTAPPDQVDAVGIGVGPSNLSTAALLDPIRGFRCEFFDRKPEFQWHGGLLFEDATLQVSFIKDLVTLVDPTSRFSFLAFLAAHGRLYRFVSAQFASVLRQEFDQYYRWVADQLDTLHFRSEIRSVSAGPRGFLVELDDRKLVTRRLILGTGLSPRLPACAMPHIGPTVFHAIEYLHRHGDVTDKSVAIVGGGQTGAEIMLRMLSGQDGRPREVTWYSRRMNFLPLDDSAFQNELFTPGYSEYFRQLPEAHRRRMIDEQTLTSDGVSSRLLQDIYQQIYAHQHVRTGQPTRYSLRPGRRLRDLRAHGAGWNLAFETEQFAMREQAGADVVILATGQHYQLPSCLEPLRTRIPSESYGLELGADFSLVWDAPPGLEIYVHNGGRQSR